MKKIIIIFSIVLLIIVSSFLFINLNKKEKIDFTYLDDDFFSEGYSSCFPASNFRGNKFIIYNESEYQELLKYSWDYRNRCENYTLPYIDFSKNILIGKSTSGSGCSVKYYRDLVLDEKNNKIIYYLKAKFSGNCLALYSDMNWVLIDKKYSDFEIEFRNKDLRDNYFLFLTFISLITIFLIPLFMIYILYNENKENLNLFFKNLSLSFSLVSGFILSLVLSTIILNKLIYNFSDSVNFFVNMRQMTNNLMVFFIIIIFITILILIYSKIKGYFKTNYFLSLLLIIEIYLLLMSSSLHLHSKLGTIVYISIIVLLLAFSSYFIYLFFKNFKKYNSLFKITNLFLLYCFVLMPLFFYFNSKSYLININKLSNLVWILISLLLILLVYGFYSVIFLKEKNKLAFPSFIFSFFLITFTSLIMVFVFSNFI
jgi:cytochrome bd-type quinol oxidase subunit 2/uncharacterized protein YxeA